MRLFRFLIVFVFFCSPALAQDAGPEALVKKMTEEVLAAVKSDKQLAAGDRQKAVKLAEEKILPHVDFEEATRLAVGRGWKEATPEQRKKLIAEFRNMLGRPHSNAIGTYEGQTMKVLPSRVKPGDSDATVRNQFLRPHGKPILV